ncbi:MAG: DUF6489 family protein [Alphaproteobacteria bacterium]
MEISIKVDCTPDEARRFLGFPDVVPMQQAMMAEIEKRMKENLSAMDPDALLKTWLPLGLEGIEKMQRAFWSQMMAPQGKREPEKKERGP